MAKVFSVVKGMADYVVVLVKPFGKHLGWCLGQPAGEY